MILLIISLYIQIGRTGLKEIPIDENMRSLLRHNYLQFEL